MTKPHVIRLRGPWELQPLERCVSLGNGQFRRDDQDLPAGGRGAVPGDWADLLGPDFRGTVRYTRHFNCPTNLDVGERVWLVCEGLDHQGIFSLNEQPLFEQVGSDEPAGFDITDLLQPRNTLFVCVTLLPEGCVAALPRPAARQSQPGGLTGEVRLEIRPRAV